jgi:hypothetical protein
MISHLHSYSAGYLTLTLKLLKYVHYDRIRSISTIELVLANLFEGSANRKHHNFFHHTNFFRLLLFMKK